VFALGLKRENRRNRQPTDRNACPEQGRGTHSPTQKPVAATGALGAPDKIQKGSRGIRKLNLPSRRWCETTRVAVPGGGLESPRRQTGDGADFVDVLVANVIAPHGSLRDIME
jgi:hypothetical protein